MKQASAPSRWRAPRCSFPLRVTISEVVRFGVATLIHDVRGRSLISAGPKSEIAHIIPTQI
jgi:hypothetical protein